MSEQTTDEGILKLKWKVAFPIVGFLLIVSNMFTRYISVLSTHTDQIEYNEEATKRRIKNAIKELNYEIDIKDLKEQLELCKDGQEKKQR